jgi:hemin uptake protein HemP
MRKQFTMNGASPGSEPRRLEEGSGGAVTRRVSSLDLFGKGERRLVIEHRGKEYVLLITRSGKLLLNRLD